MKKGEYDVIIIGAGVGGLTCACYLAKNGLKVLLIEKGANVGGCCSSIKIGGKIFDAFAHSMGAVRESSEFRILMEYLDVWKDFKFIIHEPVDIVIAPKQKISFWRDIDKTAEELTKCFPSEKKSIQKFLEFMAFNEAVESRSLIKRTFKELLDEYFSDEELKSILSVSLLGNGGLPPSKMNAFMAFKLYQEFLIDGGCYPEGGMQSFSNLLLKKYEEFGGEILLSKSVKEILTKKDKAVGVKLKNDDEIYSKIVVSNCDATLTFKEYLNKQDTADKVLEGMEPSISVFLNYFSSKKNVLEISKELNSSVWIMKDYDLDKIYNEIVQGNVDKCLMYLIHGSPDKKGFTIETLANYGNKDFWKDNKRNFSNKLLDDADTFYDRLKENVESVVMTTPIAVNKWTNNHKGAVYGWAPSKCQFSVPGFTHRTSIENLYLTGHWTTQAFGVSGVAIVAKSTAKRVLKKISLHQRIN